MTGTRWNPGAKPKPSPTTTLDEMTNFRLGFAMTVVLGAHKSAPINADNGRKKSDTDSNECA